MMQSCLRPSFPASAEIVDQAYLTARFAGEAGVAAMQDQPVMRVQHELGRNDSLQPELDLKRRLPGASPVRLPTRNTWVSTPSCVRHSHVEHDIGGLATAPGSDSISARVRGTSPPKSLISFSDSAMTFFALVR